MVRRRSASGRIVMASWLLSQSGRGASLDPHRSHANNPTKQLEANCNCLRKIDRSHGQCGNAVGRSEATKRRGLTLPRQTQLRGRDADRHQNFAQIQRQLLTNAVPVGSSCNGRNAGCLPMPGAGRERTGGFG